MLCGYKEVSHDALISARHRSSVMDKSTIRPKSNCKLIFSPCLRPGAAGAVGWVRWRERWWRGQGVVEAVVSGVAAVLAGQEIANGVPAGRMAERFLILFRVVP
jgi:hypothetical protein